MKAIILYQMQDSLIILDIPKEWEDNADEFVTNHTLYEKDTCDYLLCNDCLCVVRAKIKDDAPSDKKYDFNFTTILEE